MGLFSPGFFAQPLDLILFQLIIAFGWIPVVVVLISGFIKMWLNFRQGMYAGSLQWVLLSINVPSQTEQAPKAMENMFATLNGAYSSPLWRETWWLGKYQPQFSFEIASNEGHIQFYVR